MRTILFFLFLSFFSLSFGQYTTVWQTNSDKEFIKKNKIKTTCVYDINLGKIDSVKIEEAEYDLNGNIIVFRNYFYEKNKISDTSTWKFKYDSKNNLTSYTVFSVSDSSKLTVTHTNSYNEQKLLAGYKESKNNNKYDTFFCNYTYDKEGNIISMQNNHRTIIYQWKDKRLVKETWGGGLLGLTDSITYNYNKDFSEMQKKEYDEKGKLRTTTIEKYNSNGQIIYKSVGSDKTRYETYTYKGIVLVHRNQFYDSKLGARVTFTYTYF